MPTRLTKGLCVAALAALVSPIGGARAAEGGSGERPGGAAVSGVPWWDWTGGLPGLVNVMSMLSFAERLGSAIFTGTSVTAAVVTSTTSAGPGSGSIRSTADALSGP